MKIHSSKRHNGSLIPKFLLLVLDVARKEFTTKIVKFKKTDDKDEWHNPKNWTISTYLAHNEKFYECATKLGKICSSAKVMEKGRAVIVV